jgi:hypothetical protein
MLLCILVALDAEFELLFVLAIFVRHFHFPFTIFKTNFTLVSWAELNSEQRTYGLVWAETNLKEKGFCHVHVVVPITAATCSGVGSQEANRAPVRNPSGQGAAAIRPVSSAGVSICHPVIIDYFA